MYFHFDVSSDYEIREIPVFEVGTGHYGVTEVFGVDEAEMEETRDDNSQYHPAHAGLNLEPSSLAACASATSTPNISLIPKVPPLTSYLGVSRIS